jgi:tRNA(adenine34) deaminase
MNENRYMHEYWIKVCLALGREAGLAGNAPVGSVLVQDKVIIGEGREAGKTKNDVTCHAEIEAVRNAIHNGYTDLSGSILYTTHEPCIMCAYVIRHYKISQVVFGLEVPEIGGFSSAYPVLKATEMTNWGPVPQIISGILREECEKLDQEFRNRMI